MTEYDKQYSAYMLFYERADELEPIDQLRQVSHPAADASTSVPMSAHTSASASAAAELAVLDSTSAAESTAASEPIFSRLVDVSHTQFCFCVTLIKRGACIWASFAYQAGWQLHYTTHCLCNSSVNSSCKWTMSCPPHCQLSTQMQHGIFAASCLSARFVISVYPSL